MKKNILLLSLFPLIVFGFGSLVEKKIDTITPPSGSLTLNNSIILDSGSVNTVPYLNASKEFTSSTISQAELEHLEGITQNINTALDAQATTSTDGYLSSTDWNTFNGKQDVVSGTANEIDITANVIGISDNPIVPGAEAITLPSGTTGERPAGSAGQLRYNTTDGTFEGFTTLWGPIAGGGGDLGAVTQDIIPDADSLYDLGSALLRF